jgi:hypothetical protein
MTEIPIPDQLKLSFDLLRGAFLGATTRNFEDFNNISVESWRNLECATLLSSFAVACTFPRTPRISDFTTLPRDYEPGAQVETIEGRQLTLASRAPYFLCGYILLSEQGNFQIPITAPEYNDDFKVLWSAVTTRPTLSIVPKK